jgi:hypothetical protein
MFQGSISSEYEMPAYLRDMCRRLDFINANIQRSINSSNEFQTRIVEWERFEFQKNEKMRKAGERVNEPDVSVCSISSEVPLQELILHEFIADVKFLHDGNEESSSEDGNASSTCMAMVVMSVIVEVSTSSVTTGGHIPSIE